MHSVTDTVVVVDTSPRMSFSSVLNYFLVLNFSTFMFHSMLFLSPSYLKQLLNSTAIY